MSLEKTLIEKYGADRDGPYYTSYPVLGEWSPNFTEKDFEQGLERFLQQEDNTFSLYVHYPFCVELCNFCICNAYETKNPAAIQRALDVVCKDLEFLGSFFEKSGAKPQVREIHLGGGSPSYLDEKGFNMLIDSINSFCDTNKVEDFALEIDPRTVNQEKMKYYKTKGIDRISFGIQDFNPEVQKYVNRVQSTELVASLIIPEIRSLYKSLNFDLMYGLPLQTVESFRETIETTIDLSPDRITLLRYAHIPERKKNMRLIDASKIVDNEEKTDMFIESIETLTNAGYVHIGIDNFAKPTDDLGKAFLNRKVYRNFVGFTPGRVVNMLGVGASTTHVFGDCYAQTIYNLGRYQNAGIGNQFAIESGHRMSRDDLIRRDAIFKIMCDLGLNLNALNDRYDINGKQYFREELESLETLADEGIIEMSNGSFQITSQGRFFIRHVCKVFDKYLRNKQYKIHGT